MPKVHVKETAKYHLYTVVFFLLVSVLYFNDNTNFVWIWYNNFKLFVEPYFYNDYGLWIWIWKWLRQIASSMHGIYNYFGVGISVLQDIRLCIVHDKLS